MTELLIKTIINQARTIERYDVRACENIGLEAEVKDLETRLETVTEKYNGQCLVAESGKDSFKLYKAALEYSRKLKDKLSIAESRIAELEVDVADLVLKVRSYNPNEFVLEEPECPTEFTLNNVKYFEDETGCYMIANNGVDHFNVKITGQEYLDGANQWLRQKNTDAYSEDPEMYDESFMEDPRDYPEEEHE